MKINLIKPESFEYTKPGIENGICNRCGSKNVIGSKCMDCLNNKEIIYFTKRVQAKKKHKISLSFELSDRQKEASSFFLNHYLNKQSAYLNAICGSGKTEVQYETILRCLNDGLKPLIAIPRKEIVKELYERLKSVFVDTEIKYLDGLNHDDNADLLISTVNQLVNYYEEFDLIILDEADAFPFSGNLYLERVLNRSLKKDGVLLKMSATKKEFISLDEFTINRRYHGHKLSMPIYFKDYSLDISLNKDFLNIISDKSRKYIVYVSSINKAFKLSQKLKTEYVSSKLENIDKIIDEFKKGYFNILVSTTILERGITIPNLDVIIADASSEVFTNQTIIQICGRVGRSINDPTGNIYIFYKHNSIKFSLVDNYIRKMNK